MISVVFLNPTFCLVGLFYLHSEKKSEDNWIYWYQIIMF